MTNSISENYTVILYDGECGFCNHWVQWILRRKPSEKMRFMPLQSDTGRQILKDNQLDFDLNSIVVVDKDIAYQKSRAIQLILKNINSPYRYASVLLHVIPTIIADTVYDFIAKHRYKIIGKSNVCDIPLPEQRRFFIMN